MSNNSNMANSIVRTDRWELQPTPEQRKYLQLTQNIYRQFVRGLIGVVYTHYSDINSGSSSCAATEKLIHKTKKNPNPKYSYFDHKFYKFPSYLRRAAIEFAIGQVSSFITRYSSWQSGHRVSRADGLGKRKDALPPRLNGKTNVYAVLYKGQCIKFNNELSEAKIKVFDGSDWIWITVRIVSKRERHLDPHNKQLSPTLIVDDKLAYLSVPFEVKPSSEKFEELGGKVELVYPRGTSSWAYDGSGQVKRSKTNYANAQFTSGKQYNADLNGSQNIGARYWAWKRKLAHRNGRQLSDGKSSSDKRRMPVTLSTLWESES